MKESYATAMAEMNAPPCVICVYPERSAIEADRNAGNPSTMIARALKKIGAYPPSMSVRSVAERVRIHCREHAK